MRTGNPTYAPPFDRPYDWTASGDPTLLARTFGYFATDAGLDEVKTYADGIGPWKVYIIPITGGGGGDPQTPTDLVARAHARGLLVHTWTFRDDVVPVGLPRRAGRRAPRLLQAGRRRGLRGLPGHRLRREGDLQGPLGQVNSWTIAAIPTATITARRACGESRRP